MRRMTTRRRQTYATHIHRPTLTIVATFFLLVAVVGFALRWFLIGGRLTMALGLFGVLGNLFMLNWISRDYTVRLQDRIIRLEMRLRGATLLTPEQQRALESLSMKQVVALRFAPNGELGALLDRASREKLGPDDIKRAITDWVGDYDRT